MPKRKAAAAQEPPPASPAATPRKRSKAAAAPAPATESAALRAKAAKIRAQLAKLYPLPGIPLSHGTTFQLLVAVMLSAQSTDKKVNELTPALFSLAPDAASLAAQDVADVMQLIKPLGLAPTKAKNIVATAQLLVERHGGEVPADAEALEALPGVGHKTASVVISQAFGQPAFPVDTHIHRLAARWGLSSGRSVEQTEADLKNLLPPDTWRDAHLQMIFFGREHCPAKQHDAAACPICSWASGDGASADEPRAPPTAAAGGGAKARGAAGGGAKARGAAGGGAKARGGAQRKPKRPPAGGAEAGGAAATEEQGVAAAAPAAPSRSRRRSARVG